jgi:hypothetical protein
VPANCLPVQAYKIHEDEVHGFVITDSFIDGFIVISIATVLDSNLITRICVLVYVGPSSGHRCSLSLTEKLPGRIIVHLFQTSLSITTVQGRTIFGRSGNVPQIEKLYIFSVVAAGYQPPYTMASAPQ